METSTGDTGRGGDRFGNEPTARDLYGVLKHMWLVEEAAQRASAKKDMLREIAPWQEWLVDPVDVPPYVNGTLQPHADYSFAKLYTKGTPEPITKVLSYRRGAIVATAMMNHGRVWICPFTTKNRPEDWAVRCGTLKYRNRRGLVGLLRAVSSDLAGDPLTRELVAYKDNLNVAHRPRMRNHILGILRNLFADPDAPPPGSIVVDDDGSPAYVVTSCRFSTTDVSRNVVLACNIINAPALQGERDEDLYVRGCVRLRQSPIPEYTTPLIATMMLRPIARKCLSVVAAAHEELALVKRRLEGD